HAFAAVVEIPVEAECVLWRALRIDAKSALGLVPRVGGGGPVREDFGVAVEIFSVNPKVDAGSERATVTCAAELLELRPSARLHLEPLGRGGVLGDDIDHAIHRVGTPEGAARTADDFDAVDVLEQIV